MDNLLLRRRMMMEGEGLPAAYTRLQYIESVDFDSYIDTGFKPTNLTRCIAVLIRIDMGFTFDFSARNSAGVGAGYGFGTNGTNFISDFGGSRAVFQNILPNNTDMLLVDKNRNITTIKNLSTNEEETAVNTDSVFSVNYNLPFFAQNSAGVVAPNRKRFYLFTMYENDELILKLIPCKRNLDQELGMFDLVTKTFFANAGTGSFIGG